MCLKEGIYRLETAQGRTRIIRSLEKNYKSVRKSWRNSIYFGVEERNILRRPWCQSFNTKNGVKEGTGIVSCSLWPVGEWWREINFTAEKMMWYRRYWGKSEWLDVGGRWGILQNSLYWRLITYWVEQSIVDPAESKRINCFTYIVSVLYNAVLEQHCATLYIRTCFKQNKMQTLLKLSCK